MHHSGAARKPGKRLDEGYWSLGSSGLMRVHWVLLGVGAAPWAMRRWRGFSFTIFSILFRWFSCAMTRL